MTHTTGCIFHWYPYLKQYSTTYIQYMWIQLVLYTLWAVCQCMCWNLTDSSITCLKILQSKFCLVLDFKHNEWISLTAFTRLPPARHGHSTHGRGHEDPVTSCGQSYEAPKRGYMHSDQQDPGTVTPHWCTQNNIGVLGETLRTSRALSCKIARLINIWILGESTPSW